MAKFATHTERQLVKVLEEIAEMAEPNDHEYCSIAGEIRAVAVEALIKSGWWERNGTSTAR